MNQEHLSDELLSRHFDGDLPAAEDEPVRVHLETCAQCSAQLATLGRLSQLIKAAALDTAGAAAVDFQSMYARIERATLAEANGGQHAPMQAASRPARERVPTPAPFKKLRRIGPLAPALGALAIAAAAMLMVFRDNGTPEAAPDDVVGEQFAARSEIVDYDFGGNNGAVWDIALADGSSVPVAWIDDDDGADEDEGQ